MLPWFGRLWNFPQQKNMHIFRNPKISSFTTSIRYLKCPLRKQKEPDLQHSPGVSPCMALSRPLPCFSENLRAPRQLEIPGFLSMVAHGRFRDTASATAQSQPATALGRTQQNWVEIFFFFPQRRARATRHLCP